MSGPESASAGDLRQVFGAYPTGVAAIAAAVDGEPVGLTASSFTSVSLEPPLASFCIAHSSTTWPRLRRARVIGISFLASDQAEIGRALSVRSTDRFSDVEWELNPEGAVYVRGATAYLDGLVERQITAGDHEIVVVRVLRHRLGPQVTPLIFHGSRFRSLA